MTLTSPFLYLPMEIASRELDARLLTAIYATRAGMEVVMGQKWLLQKNAGHMPTGTWLFKTLTPGDAKQMQKVARFGHPITAIDEEMPGLGEGAKRLRWVDPRAVAATTRIFCLGSRHVDVMAQKFPDATGKLVMTGNPRWDFLRKELRGVYSADAEALTARHGRFILVNTNIGLVNSAKNSAEALVNALNADGRINLADPVDKQWVDDLLAFERSNFAAAIPLVKKLRESFPGHKVILRPHPTEKIEPYLAKLSGLEGIEVLREGPAAAWIMASDVLVHTSCTTANEAFALGRPAICYETCPSPLHDYFLSGKLSLVARSEDEVLQAVAAVLGGKMPDLSEQTAIFRQFFAAQDGDFAAKRVVDNLLPDTLEVPRESQWKPGALFRRIWWPTKFQRSMFPDFSTEDLTARLRQLVETAGLGAVPLVWKLGDGLYHLRPADMLLSPKTMRRLLPI